MLFLLWPGKARFGPPLRQPFMADTLFCGALALSNPHALGPEMPVVPLARCEPRKSPHRGAGNLSIDAAMGDDAGYGSRVSHFESIGLVDHSQTALCDF
jgi:hypothetical protein